MITIFLSYSTPVSQRQRDFLERVSTFLSQNQITPLTLTKDNYDMDAPLAGVRRLMVGTCGLMTLAFRRSWTSELSVRRGADLPGVEATTSKDVWLTSAYAQIEPAMAYQLGLPILILKEKGVLAEGVLEPGITGMTLPEFSLDDGVQDFDRLTIVMHQWIGRVKGVYDKRGEAPRLH